MAETKADLEAKVAELEARLAEQASTEDSGPDNRTVIQRILAVAAEVGVLAPERSGGVPFAFRGVDATVSKLTPLLNKHQVFIAPTQVVQELTQRDVPGGKVVTKADLVVHYRAYGAAGDHLDFQVPGQADDFADRSTAQAMSVAFRILLLQVFHIAANGNEEEASEATKNSREQAGLAKVDNARAASAPAAPAQTGASPAANMRSAILAAAGAKGWDGARINEFIDGVTGVGRDQWWENPELLNKALLEIHKA
jgi:hypothetical protein